MSSMEIANVFLAAARETLAEGMHKIEHCVGQLGEEQVWWRPEAGNSHPVTHGLPGGEVKPQAGAKNAASEMNSIANLMLHLAGNVRQWIVAGVGGAGDVRNRPREFADRSGQPKSELLALVKGTVAEADAVLARLTADELVAKRRIQGFDTNVTAAIFGTISHFRGHVQEMIHLTRQQLGYKYRFDFVPQGVEQESAGAAGSRR
jgi:hypothetical protein